jgi:hypothetical protein
LAQKSAMNLPSEAELELGNKTVLLVADKEKKEFRLTAGLSKRFALVVLTCQIFFHYPSARDVAGKPHSGVESFPAWELDDKFRNDIIACVENAVDLQTRTAAPR